MHALPLLSTLVDPFEILFRQAGRRPACGAGLGDEPNPEARQFLAGGARRHGMPQRGR